MGMPEIPPLGAGEYIHIEYVQGQRDEDEGPVTHFSNMVDIRRTRESAIDKATRLIADEDVWAIHLRRYEPPEQDVHLYDESQPLARAQGEAHQFRTAYEELSQAFMKLEDAKTSMEAEYERQTQSTPSFASSAGPDECCSCGGPADHSEAGCQGIYECPSCGQPEDHRNINCCSSCGHDEARHTFEARDEGGRDYCTECDGAEEFHAFDEEPKAPQSAPQESAEELRAQLQHQTDRRDLAEDMVEALRKRIGEAFDVEPMLREIRARYDAAKLPAPYVPEIYPDFRPNANQVKLDAMRARVAGTPEDRCICGHPLSKHVATGPEYGCHGGGDCEQHSVGYHSFNSAWGR